MADDKTTFRLDLDASEFLKSIAKAQESVTKVGDASNLKGLVSALDSAVPLIGAVGVGFLAVKAAMENTFEAENIKAINQQFEILSENAGVATETLRSGLIKAADGLIDETALLQEANKAIVLMGGSAGKLPEILELSRKAAVVTGKDLKSTFEDLTFAVSTGNERLLKRMRIVLDVKKAEEAYAVSIGLFSKDALSEAEKKQAILNATLEKGKASYAGISDSVKDSTNTWERFKVAVTETKEALILLFDKTIGPYVNAGLKTMASLAKDAADQLKISFGTAHEKAEGLGSQLAKAKKELQDFLDSGGPDKPRGQLFLEAAQNNIKKLEDNLKSLKSEAGVGRETSGGSDLGSTPPQDTQRRTEAEAKFQKEVADLRKQGIKDSIDAMKDETLADGIYKQQQIVLEEEHTAQIEAIEAKFLAGTEQRKQLTQIANQNFENKKTALLINQEAERQRIVEQSLRNQENDAKGFFDKFAAGAKSAATKSKHEFTDFSKTGSDLTKKMANNVSGAFADIAAGAVDVGTGLKRAIIGALADIAAAKGAEATLGAFATFPPNFAMLGAGIGLSALSGVLRAAAGGGSSPISASGGGGGGVASAAGNVEQAPGARPEVADQQIKNKQVSIVVQGHVFDTEATRIRIGELVREAGDNSDFRVTQIGGGVA